jgi:hypothetical protein
MKHLNLFRRLPAFHPTMPGKAAAIALLTAILLWSLAFTFGKTGKPLRIYVSPAGDDAAAGTRKAPLATLAAAQVAVRTAKAGNNRPVEVVLREGTYFLTAPLTFTPLMAARRMRRLRTGRKKGSR